MKALKLFVLGLAALTLAACSGMGGGETGKGPAGVEDLGTSGSATSTAGASNGSEGAATTAVGAADTFDGRPLNPGDSSDNGADRWVVYFNYDSNVVDPSYTKMLAAHAAYLAQHPELTLTLQGNTDERGTREYNIGLGERRAQAVRDVLILQGAPSAQIATVSYGEERPAATGHDEAAWRLNRRVELIYSHR